MTDQHLRNIKLCEDVFRLNGLHFDLKRIRSRYRDSDIVFERRLTARLLRKNTGLSFTQIGEFMGIAHCSVLHLVKSDGWDRKDKIILSLPDKKQDILTAIKYHELELKKLYDQLGE